MDWVYQSLLSRPFAYAALTGLVHCDATRGSKESLADYKEAHCIHHERDAQERKHQWH